MKIKKDFILRNIADTHIVVPVGERVVEFKGMMTLNDTGSFIWKNLTQEVSYEELLALILDEYDIDEETAKKDLDAFIVKAHETAVLEE